MEKKSYKILITGASGFIGSHLVERALKEGFETWAAVRPTSSKRYLGDGRIRFVELDLSDTKKLGEQLTRHVGQYGQFDSVIHAAGATKCRRADDFFRINAEGTRSLALMLTETGALKENGRFVFISSLSVMGPLHEKDLRPISDKETPRPNTAYGCSKLQAENYLAEIKGLNYVILRPTGVYGPREKDYAMMADSIRRYVDFAVGYKPQILTFIYVADLVEAAILALRRGRTGRAYFLTDGGEYTSRTFSDLIQMCLHIKHVVHITAPLWVLYAVSTVAEKWAALTQKASTLNRDKYRIMRQRNWRCDIRLAREELGYIPKYPLVKGVELTFSPDQASEC